MKDATPMDWEAVMTETQQKTNQTAKMTERCLGALTEVIEIQNKQSRATQEISASIKSLGMQQEALRSLQTVPHKVTYQQKQGTAVPRFWIGGALVVGMALGAFIGSW